METGGVVRASLGCPYQYALDIMVAESLVPKGAKGMQITTEQAERVLKASILKARELGVSVCIAILDSGGHLTIGKPEGRLNPKEIAKMVEVIPSREGEVSQYLSFFVGRLGQELPAATLRSNYLTGCCWRFFGVFLAGVVSCVFAGVFVENR
jgi:hypothetical protein